MIFANELIKYILYFKQNLYLFTYYSTLLLVVHLQLQNE